MGDSRTSRGHVVVLAAGAALVATSFVPLWATYRIPGLGIVAPRVVHANAWSAYGLGMQLALCLALAALAIAAVCAAARVDRVRERPLLLGLSAATTLLLAWEVVAGPEGATRSNGYGIDRALLSFAAPLLGACMTYGSSLVGRKPARRRPVGDDVTRAPRDHRRGE